ncbi:MAG: aldo/keto reductase, partial [Proteobacteria bacterium]|nr:aldo/keto reductase [Pseudomonadota bacterium]
MQLRKLGNSDLGVSSQGLGCREIAGGYGARDGRKAIAVLDRALELGIKFLDSAEVYGAGETKNSLADGSRNLRWRGFTSDAAHKAWHHRYRGLGSGTWL